MILALLLMYKINKYVTKNYHILLYFYYNFEHTHYEWNKGGRLY